MKCLVNGQITETLISECTGYVLLEPVDLQQHQSFNKDLYLEVSGYLLLSFFVGHGAGRVVRWMSK